MSVGWSWGGVFVVFGVFFLDLGVRFYVKRVVFSE